MSHMTLIDNHIGATIQTGKVGDIQKTVLTESVIYGESGSEDCPPKPHDCYCDSKMGFMLMGANDGGGKDLHIP
jgi:hypothetical protein